MNVLLSFTTLLLIQFSYADEDINNFIATNTEAISDCCDKHCPISEWRAYCPSGNDKSLAEMETCMGGIFSDHLITENTLFKKCNKGYRDLKKCVCDGHKHGQEDNPTGEDIAYECCNLGCSISHLRKFCGHDNKSQILRIKSCIIEKKLVHTELTESTPIKMCPPQVRPLMNCICNDE